MLMIREMQIKIMMSYYLILMRIDFIYKKKKAQVPGWLSWLSFQLLVLTQVMISHLWA